MTLSTNDLIQEVFAKLDYSLDLKGRMDIVSDIDRVYGEQMQEIYAKYKNSNLKKYTNRTFYDKMCNMFDRLSEYILFSTIPDDIKEGLKYKKSEIPYSQESNLKTLQAHNEISFEGFARSISSVEGMDKKKYDDQNHGIYSIAYFAERMKKCPYIHDYIRYNTIARNIIQELDRQIDRLVAKGECPTNSTLLEYEKANGKKIKYTVQQLSALKRGIGYTKNNSKEIDQDIVAILREYFRPMYFNSVDNPTERRRILNIDLMDREHVSGLLKVSALTGWDDKFDKYIQKLDDVASKTNLTEMEADIYTIFKTGKGKEIKFENFEDNKMTITECSRIMDKVQSSVDKSFNRLVDKLVDKYEEIYEDYYFTYLARGTYKTCSKCGEVKLANERYFSPKRDSKDGFHPYCKKCR